MPNNPEEKKATRRRAWLELGPVPAAILVLICTVCVALLALTASVTEDARAYQDQWLADMNKRELFPQADSFPEEALDRAGEGLPGAQVLDLTGRQPEISLLAAAGVGKETVGVIIRVSSKGYGGQLPVLVGFDLSGKLVGLVVDASGETPGLGQKTAESAFTGQFEGRLAVDPFSDIDAVSSATISSDSVINSVRAASKAFNELFGEGGK